MGQHGPHAFGVGGAAAWGGTLHRTNMNRDEFINSILTDGANNRLPEQIGPRHTLEQIAIVAELKSQGLITGHVTTDGNGHPCNILHPEISPAGRMFLENAKKNTVVMRYGPKVIKWFIGIIAGLLLAWLVRLWQLK